MISNQDIPGLFFQVKQSLEKKRMVFRELNSEREVSKWAPLSIKAKVQRDQTKNYVLLVPGSKDPSLKHYFIIYFTEFCLNFSVFSKLFVFNKEYKPQILQFVNELNSSESLGHWHFEEDICKIGVTFCHFTVDRIYEVLHNLDQTYKSLVTEYIYPFAERLELVSVVKAPRTSKLQSVLGVVKNLMVSMGFTKFKQLKQKKGIEDLNTFMVAVSYSQNRNSSVKVYPLVVEVCNYLISLQVILFMNQEALIFEHSSVYFKCLEYMNTLNSHIKHGKFGFSNNQLCFELELIWTPLTVSQIKVALHDAISYSLKLFSEYVESFVELYKSKQYQCSPLHLSNEYSLFYINQDNNIVTNSYLNLDYSFEEFQKESLIIEKLRSVKVFLDVLVSEAQVISFPDYGGKKFCKQEGSETRDLVDFLNLMLEKGVLIEIIPFEYIFVKTTETKNWYYFLGEKLCNFCSFEEQLTRERHAQIHWQWQEQITKFLLDSLCSTPVLPEISKVDKKYFDPPIRKDLHSNLKLAGMDVELVEFTDNSYFLELSQIFHPNVVQVLGYCEVRKKKFLVREKLASLDTIGTLTVPQKKKVVAGITRAYSFIYSKNKFIPYLLPTEVFVDAFFEAKILVKPRWDFRSRWTYPNYNCCTIHDCYALGMLLYYILVGKDPLEGIPQTTNNPRLQIPREFQETNPNLVEAIRLFWNLDETSNEKAWEALKAFSETH